MTVEFRKAELKDVEVLTEMRMEMRRERETEALTIPEKAFRDSVRAFFQKTLLDGTFISYLAVVDGVAAACSGMSLQPLPPSYGNPQGLRGYITNMYTRRGWRGHGLATKLLDCLMGEARRQGCAKVYLNASAAGRPVYEKYGFKDVSGEMNITLTNQ